MDRRGFFLTGIGVVALQRIALPVGTMSLPLMNVILITILALLFALRRASASPIRVIAFLGLMVCGLVVLFVTNASITALALIAVLWAPTVLATPQARAAQSSFVAGVVTSTSVASALAVIQSLISGLTGLFLDPVSALPEDFRLQGYNSSDPVLYGMRWMKSNGMVFLEPSFLSLMAIFSIIAVVSGAAGQNWKRSKRIVLLLLLFAGFSTAVAASGLVLVPALLIALAGRGLKPFLYTAAGAAGALALLAVTPLWGAITSRVFTLDLDAGSNAARLVRPYKQILTAWFNDGPWYGNGPGSARVFAQSLYVDWRGEVTTPTLVKMLYEYGVVGMAAAVLMLLLVFTASALPISYRFAVILALFVPTDGLSSGMLVAIAAMSSIALGRRTGTVEDPDRSVATWTTRGLPVARRDLAPLERSI